jgi:hypothetical protein
LIQGVTNDSVGFNLGFLHNLLNNLFDQKLELSLEDVFSEE